MLSGSARRGLIVSRVWIQASVLVMLFGFAVMGMLAYGANDGAPPVPRRVVDPSGSTLFAGIDIVAGQEVFLRNGLMEYGSIFGHGAYLGPDYTADALRRAALDVLDQYGGATSDQARARTLADFKTNRYEAGSGTLVLSAAQVHAYQTLRNQYQAFFANPTTENGLRPAAIADPEQIRQLTSFFTWSAWAAAAQRPGQSYSYTNNWPPEPLVGNTPTADSLVWSVLSLIALLGGIGMLFGAFGRWDVLGWRGRERQSSGSSCRAKWR